MKDIRSVLPSLDYSINESHINCSVISSIFDPIHATCSIDSNLNDASSNLIVSHISNLESLSDFNQICNNNECNQNLFANDNESTNVNCNLKNFNCCIKKLSKSENDCYKKQLEKQQEEQAAKLLKEEDSFFTCLNFNQENNRLASFAGEIRVGASFQVFLNLIFFFT